MIMNRHDPMIGHVRYLHSEILSGAVEILIHLKRVDAVRVRAVRDARGALLTYLASAHERNLKGGQYLWPYSTVGRMVAEGIGLGCAVLISFRMVRDRIHPHIRVLRRFERGDVSITDEELAAAADFLKRLALVVQAREAVSRWGRSRNFLAA